MKTYVLFVLYNDGDTGFHNIEASDKDEAIKAVKRKFNTIEKVLTYETSIER